jgi:hypothetical protein
LHCFRKITSDVQSDLSVLLSDAAPQRCLLEKNVSEVQNYKGKVVFQKGNYFGKAGRFPKRKQLIL